MQDEEIKFTTEKIGLKKKYARELKVLGLTRTRTHTYIINICIYIKRLNQGLRIRTLINKI